MRVYIRLVSSFVYESYSPLFRRIGWKEEKLIFKSLPSSITHLNVNLQFLSHLLLNFINLHYWSEKFRSIVCFFENRFYFTFAVEKERKQVNPISLNIPRILLKIFVNNFPNNPFTYPHLILNIIRTLKRLTVSHETFRLFMFRWSD